MTISELEQKLGEPSDFIIGVTNRHLVARWAILKGHEPVAVYAMGNVQLANLYHAQGGSDKPSEEQRAAAEIFTNIIEAVQIGSIDPELIRRLVKEEIAKQPSKKLEVISPRGSIVLEGARHYKTETIIKIAAIGHPIMMVGPAGCGKTTIGEHVANALQLPFYVTSTINDTHELTGFIDGYGKYHDTPFRNAYQKGGVWIADEIDAWDASALLAANSALANGFATFPDLPEPIQRHPDFRMIATANTFGSGADRVYVGRNELDAASLDRFATVDVDYDLTLEQMFAGSNDKWLNHVWKIRKAVTKKKIRHVVSSRAIIMGATALNIGMNWDEVEEIYLLKGMSETDRKKIE